METELADFAGTLPFGGGVLQLSKLFALAARIGQQQVGLAQNGRVQFLLAGPVGAYRRDVGAGHYIGEE